MILQVGLRIETGKQVAVEIVEAVGADEDLELLTCYGRPDLEGEAVLGAIAATCASSDGAKASG